MKIVTPASEADLIESIREAIDKAAPLQVQGNGSRAGLGRPASGSTKLSMAELSGITLLEPKPARRLRSWKPRLPNTARP